MSKSNEEIESRIKKFIVDMEIIFLGDRIADVEDEEKATRLTRKFLKKSLFNGILRNGNYYEKQTNGEYFSLNSLSKIKP